MATRLYSSAGTPGITPTPSSGWEDTASFLRKAATITAGSFDDTGTPLTAGSGVANDDTCWYQLVYGPLDTQTLTGTFKGQMSAREANAASDARIQCIIRTIQSDGSTVRGTNLAMSTAVLSHEFFVDASNRRNITIPLGGSTSLTSVGIQAGDYLVIEVGFRNHGTNTSAVRGKWTFEGANSTDAPEDETTTAPSVHRGWVEFSQTLVPYTAAPAVVATATGAALNATTTVAPTPTGPATATGAAYDATVSYVAPPRSVTINGTDYIGDALYSGFSLTECANRGEVGTGGFDVVDTVSALSIPAMKAVQFNEPAAGDSNKRMYTGYTHNRTTEALHDSALTAKVWGVETVDLNILASDFVLTDAEGADRPAETDYVRVAWLLTSALNSVGGVGVGVVPNANTVTMEATDYRGRQPADLLAECSEASRKLWFIYDYGSGPKLYYDLATGTSLPATAKLSDKAGDPNGSTVLAVQNVRVKKSPDRVYSKIHYTYNGGTVTVSDAAVATAYRQREKPILDATVTDSVLATVKANALLAGAAAEFSEVEGLEYDVAAAYVNDIRQGQLVDLKLTRHGIAAYTSYRIVRRTVEPLQNRTHYHVSLELADNVLASANGARGGDEIWPQKSNANDDGATVIVDRSGISILDGALTLIDAFGTTVMQASGFSGTWTDFIRLGLYNARFTAADTSGIADGRTSDLPYWTSAPTGTGALIGLTSAGVKSTFGALNDVTRITADAVPVRPGAVMEAGLSYLSNRAAGTLTINGFVFWFQADGSASATVSTTFANEVTTASVSTLRWVNNSLIVPSDAVSAQYRITVTESGTHNAANYVSIYGAKLVDQPVPVPPGVFISDTGIASVVTPSGTSDDYDPGSIDTTTFQRVNPSAAWTLRGLVAPTRKWALLYLFNQATAFTTTIKNENAGSAAANRFSTPGAADFLLTPLTGCLLLYNTTLSRWLVLTSA